MPRDREPPPPTRTRERAAPWVVAAAVVLTLAISAAGAHRLKPQGGYDGASFVHYADVLRATGGLPARAVSYEYASPPAYLWEAVQLQRVGDALGTGGGIALALVALGLGAAAAAARRRRTACAALAAAALVTGSLAAVAFSAHAEWTPGQLISVAWAGGLVVAGWLLAREVWPDRPLVAAGAAVLTAAVPIVIRLGTMFHPEMQLACLAALALVLTLRARRRAWPLVDGAALGIVLGVAALTRQTTVVVAVALFSFVLTDGRRRALPFLTTALVALVLIAGPWWAWQTHVYGNPLQSNLDRYILDGGQPRSFYVSAPLRTLVVHPYRPDFAGQLWPQFHADLWSDWFGGQHAFWHQPSAAARFFASSQSVLGLLATPLALGGLLWFGGAGLARVLRGGASQREAAFAAFLVLAGLAWAAFVTQLIRFPQAGGDPIKASYMLFLAPVFAISGLAAGRWLWRRGRGWQWALGGWLGLYAVSYLGFLATSWPR